MTMTVSTGKTGKGCISDDGKEMLGRQRIRRALFNRRKRRGGKKERKGNDDESIRSGMEDKAISVHYSLIICFK